MWHLDGDDLLHCGFALEWLEEDATVVDTADPDSLHINILELIALIINIWLTLVSIIQHGNIPRGHIISMLADILKVVVLLSLNPRRAQTFVMPKHIWSQTPRQWRSSNGTRYLCNSNFPSY
jgi:hypothetical protein